MALKKTDQVIGNAEGKENLRKEVEAQLAAAVAKIAVLTKKAEEIKESKCS